VLLLNTSTSPTVSSATNAAVMTAALALIGISWLTAPLNSSANSPVSALISSAVASIEIFCSGKSKPSGAVPGCSTLTSELSKLPTSARSSTSSGSGPRLRGVVTRSP